MILASIESLLGSLWFAGLALVVGYIVGHLFPINAIKGLFDKGK
jgi:hypothetical protein